MRWIKNWFLRTAKPQPTAYSTPEAVIRFYQDVGFFTDSKAVNVLKRWTAEMGGFPDPSKRWDDAYLLRLSVGDVWADDPEADVCAENRVYSEVLLEWANVSHGAFNPRDIDEQWEGEKGPVHLAFTLAGRPAKISPAYQNDWIDLEVLRQINDLIAASGRQFECATDCNFALVVCLTPEQKQRMRTERNFPFAW